MNKIKEIQDYLGDDFDWEYVPSHKIVTVDDKTGKREVKRIGAVWKIRTCPDSPYEKLTTTQLVKKLGLTL